MLPHGLSGRGEPQRIGVFPYDSRRPLFASRSQVECCQSKAIQKAGGE